MKFRLRGGKKKRRRTGKAQLSQPEKQGTVKLFCEEQQFRSTALVDALTICWSSSTASLSSWA